MNSLYSIFCNIVPASENQEQFSVESVSPNLPHKIGKTFEGYPILFIECIDDTPTTDIRLKLFAVSFNQMCNLSDSEGVISKRFNVILLKSDDADIQQYFFELVSLIFHRLPSRPTVNGLKIEISKVISLFTASASLSRDVVKGLWTELFIIANSETPEYLIQSWHVSPEDKYDFNDGKDKIEVKSTSSTIRKHSFAIEQLNPNPGSKLLIASVVVVASGMGKNIFDLIDDISSRVSIEELILKVKQIVYETIGPHIDEVSKIRFDFNMALNTVAFFDYRNVPSINLSDVPNNVHDVHFTSILSDSAPYDLTTADCLLFEAL